MSEQQPPWSTPQGRYGYPPPHLAPPPYASAQAGAPRSTIGALALALGLAGVALGLLATVLQYVAIRSGDLGTLGWISWIATPMLVAATVLGIVGLRQPGRPRGAAAAGLALGAAPLLSLAFTTLLFANL